MRLCSGVTWQLGARVARSADVRNYQESAVFEFSLTDTRGQLPEQTHVQRICERAGGIMTPVRGGAAALGCNGGGRSRGAGSHVWGTWVYGKHTLARHCGRLAETLGSLALRMCTQTRRGCPTVSCRQAEHGSVRDNSPVAVLYVSLCPIFILLPSRGRVIQMQALLGRTHC